MRRKTIVSVAAVILVVGLVAVLALGSLYQLPEGPSPIGPRHDQLTAWVAQRANVARVRNELVGSSSLHRRGERTWTELVTYLERCQQIAVYGQLRAAMDQSAALLLHSTESQMTWMLFDEQDTARRYFTTSPEECQP